MPTPTCPGFRDVEFSINDSVAQVLNPFTQQGQYQQWAGGDWWEATLTLPKMTRTQAAQWLAFLMAARGAANCFLIGDPSMITPQGNPQGTPLVDNTITTNNTAMTTALVTKGWLASTTRLLLPGDYIQIGNRLHVLLNTVNSDSGGAATLQLWPSLREQPANNAPVICNNAKGLFRLAMNKRTWSVDETRLFGLSFKVIEAK